MIDHIPTITEILEISETIKLKNDLIIYSFFGKPYKIPAGTTINLIKIDSNVLSILFPTKNETLIMHRIANDIISIDLAPQYFGLDDYIIMVPALSSEHVYGLTYHQSIFKVEDEQEKETQSNKPTFDFIKANFQCHKEDHLSLYLRKVRINFGEECKCAKLTDENIYLIDELFSTEKLRKFILNDKKTIVSPDNEMYTIEDYLYIYKDKYTGLCELFLMHETDI